MLFAFIIFLLSYGIAYFLPYNVRFSYFVVLTAHTMIVLVYAYSGIEFIGATEDADSFYKHAISRSLDIGSLHWDIRTLSNGHDLFKNLHALLQYFFGGPSKILSYSTALFAEALCLLLLVKTYYLINKDDYFGANIIVYLYGLLPSILLFHSYLLREVWLALFVLWIMFLFIKAKDSRWTIRDIFSLILISCIAVFFHRYMVVFILVIFMVAMFFYSIKKYSWYPFNNHVLLLNGIILLVLLSTIVFAFGDMEGTLHLLRYGVMDALEIYLQGLAGGHGDGAPPARATYGIVFNKESIFSIFEAFLAYQLMPFPWIASSFVDLVPIMESVLRIALVYMFFRYRNKLAVDKQINVDMLFVIWLAIEIIWAVGTINWGTALRHHTVAYGFILLVGISSIRANFLSNKV